MGRDPASGPDRCTFEDETPTRLAIERPLQCVSPSGFSCNVERTISSTFSAGIDGFGPGLDAPAAKFTSPSSANRSRHAATVARRDMHLAAIRVFATPPAAINIAPACNTSR